MKQEILNYLKTDRSYEAGIRLYMKYGNHQGFKRTLNQQACTDYLKQMLYEQLALVAGITNQELHAILAKPVTLVAKMEVSANEPVGDNVDHVVDAPVTDEEKQKFIQDIPENVRKAIRLRDEYPFLASPDCPQEFKILVHDMLTAYGTYVEEHKKLFEATTGEELQTIAANVVENYIENREIWDELNHFKTTGQILGKHKIFAQSARIAEINAMSTPDLVKLQNSLKSNISRTQNLVTREPEHKNTSLRKESIEKWKFELDLVNKKIGLDAPKTV